MPVRYYGCATPRPDHIIIRSSWLANYAYSGRFKDILDAAIAGKKYEARVDQFAAPTSMATYVEFMIKALEQKATGTFHIVSKGRASRYDFAAKIRAGRLRTGHGAGAKDRSENGRERGP